MSASLVGSEMCIRDRWGPRWWSVSVTSHWPETIGNTSWPGTPVRRMRPVSYTHLTLPTICSV
eukprot:619373-Alexandrium_andersonii.AAC.1